MSETKVERKTEAKAEYKGPVTAAEEVEALEYAYRHDLFQDEPPYRWKSGKYGIWAVGVGDDAAWLFRGDTVCKFEWPGLDLFEQAEAMHKYLINTGAMPAELVQEWIDDWNGYMVELAERYDDARVDEITPEVKVPESKA